MFQNIKNCKISYGISKANLKYIADMHMKMQDNLSYSTYFQIYSHQQAT